MTFKQLQIANESLSTMDIKGKDYVMVNERIKAFRMLYPNGTIGTEITYMDNGVVVMKATVADDFGNILATGHAYEKEQSSYINKTSYIENCETSAVGRALGMLGIGIDVSVASAEEMENAIKQQDEMKPITDVQIDVLSECLEKHGKTIKGACDFYGVSSLKDFSVKQYIDLMNRMGEK